MDTNYGQDVKFSIIAHSMGGLITKFYLAYTEFCNNAVLEMDKLKKKTANDPDNMRMKQAIVYGSIAQIKPDKKERDKEKNKAGIINKVILIGTPNSGSMEIVKIFITGNDSTMPINPTPMDVIKSISTMPSTYQLLPRVALEMCFKDCHEEIERVSKKDLYQQVVWESLDKYANYGAPDPEKNDTEIAKIRKFRSLALRRAEEFMNALNTEEAKSVNKEIFLIGSDRIPTLEKGLFDGKVVLFHEDNIKEKIRSDLENRGTLGQEAIEDKINEKFLEYYAPGDGTVTRSSMLGGARYKNTMFTSATHLGLVQDPSVIDNILYYLLEDDDDIERPKHQPLEQSQKIDDRY